MAPRYFKNPYPNYVKGHKVIVPEDDIINLVKSYVSNIIKYTYNEQDKEGDLYVGSAGIAYMFHRLATSNIQHLFPEANSYARHYINKAKARIISHKIKAQDTVSFLCGNAGVWAVSAAISKQNGLDYTQDLAKFSDGFQVCENITFNNYGNDEILFGRAGYLSAIYWLNQTLGGNYFESQQIIKVCEKLFESGRSYSQAKNHPIPLMYECYGDEYIGAAHGISSIYHMFLEAFHILQDDNKKIVIKQCIDKLLHLQDKEGNFPPSFDEVSNSSSLVHWCHGAPGVVYVFAKAALVYNDNKYLVAAEKCGALTWEKGLLRKGPGICHGVAGNGYVFLLLHRLTNNEEYLYKAVRFFEFLQNETFLNEARTPDRPFSLYEGISGTICYLLDLLNPQSSSFPFMDIFDQKC